MPIYNIDGKNLTHIQQVNISKEKDLQNLVEKNIELLFNLKFIATEVALEDLRMDSLAFNEETKSFVIIEYKIRENYSVIDQGYSYLSLLLSRKLEFVDLYNKTFGTHFEIRDFDFSKTKVMFISTSYNKYQLRAVQFEDIAFELWKVVKYSDGLISFNKVNNKGKHVSINQISNNNSIRQNVYSEIRNYSEEEYLKDKSDNSKELYCNLKEQILSEFDDVEVEPMKKYIKFTVNNQTIATCVLQLNNLKIQINASYLDDSKGITKELNYSGGEGVGKYLIKISSEKDFNDFMELFKQSYGEKI